MPSSELCALRNRQFGLVFQKPFMLADLTLLENCMLSARYRNDWGRKEAEQRAGGLLDYVGLLPMADRLPQTLSGGELQRLGLARALLNEPEILFADEPTVSLDADNAGRVMELLAQQHKVGRSVVLVSHDSAVLQWAERVICFEALVGGEP